MKWTPLALALLLAGCGWPFSGPQRAPYLFGDKGDLVDFHYGWSAEAAAIPALEARFRAALDKAWKAELAASVADRAAAARAGRKYESHQFRLDWTTAGQSRRLLSLEGTANGFVGDNHLSHASAALLWDRSAKAIITPATLFTRPADMQALLQPGFCTALDRERAKRRAVAVAHPRSRGCPPLGEVIVVPSDSDWDGRFDSLRLTADPNVAGSLPEGAYRVILPVTASLAAAIQPRYRSSFEIAQPQ